MFSKMGMIIAIERFIKDPSKENLKLLFQEEIQYQDINALYDSTRIVRDIKLTPFCHQQVHCKNCPVQKYSHKIIYSNIVNGVTQDNCLEICIIGSLEHMMIYWEDVNLAELWLKMVELREYLKAA